MRRPESCRRPRNRAVVDVVPAGNLPQGFPVFLAAKNFLPLVRGLALRLHDARLRPLPALAGAVPR
jgi:hypothetical protein